jgi:hypothetical protein
MSPKRIVVLCFAVVIGASCTSRGASPSQGASRAANASPGSGSATPGPAASAEYAVTYDPADFSATVDNPWFPLKPGTTLIYVGTKDEEPAREILTVTDQVKKIDGVPCRIIHDRLYLSGKLAESTSDYYTQDREGNVWYFGEDTAEFDEQLNVVSTEGTWHTAEAGALPGIFMSARPEIGVSHRQEYYKGYAEDFFRAVDLSASVTVPYGPFSDALRTEEWTPLEPGVLDNKYYVKGIGEVREASVKGPVEKLALAEVRTG